MADISAHGTDIVSKEEFEALRTRVSVPDTYTKTLKWLEAQILERESKIKAYQSQMANIEGMIEVAEDQLKELQERRKKLETLK